MLRSCSTRPDGGESAFKHAEALHDLLMGSNPSARADDLAYCVAMLSAAVPCSAPHRPHDLALSTFIESPLRDWHLEGAEDLWVMDLFNRYVLAGQISLDRPVHETTARSCTGTLPAPSGLMYPLELAIRRRSAEVACSLILLGCDEGQVGAEVLSLAANNDGGGLPMHASIQSALMSRRLLKSPEGEGRRTLPRRGHL